MIQLGEEQIIALDKLKEFISWDNKEKYITLCGSAGTGKTTIVKYLRNFMDKNFYSYTMAAPTHRAAIVLRGLIGDENVEVTTLHKMLSLSPNIEIFNLDLRELEFVTRDKVPYVTVKSVVIIDEASMVNDELFDLLIKVANEYNLKIIFIGDIKQLQPVKSKTVSKVFKCPNMVTLNTIYRQKEDSPVFSILLELRENPIYHFETQIGKDDSVLTFNTPIEFINSCENDFHQLVNNKDLLHCKILAYTNARVANYNRLTRQLLFKQDANNELNAGEILTGYDNLEFNNMEFFNSMDYIVTDVFEIDYQVPYFKTLKALDVHVYDAYHRRASNVIILSRSNSDEDFTRLGKLIEEVRIEALTFKQRGWRKQAAKSWKRYFEIINSFALWQDLFHDNRIVKKKTFDYGYAQTVHKS